MSGTSAKTKKAAEAKPRAMLRTVETDTPEPNPLWHSLALRPAGVQAKLAVSHPDDPFEREADRIADYVMGSPTPRSQRQPPVHELTSFTPQPGVAARVQRQSTGDVPGKGAKVGKKKSLDVEVETQDEMLVAALLPWVGTMRIVGRGREYIKKHLTTAEIRLDFFTALYKAVEDEKKGDYGKLTGDFDPGLRRFGSIWGTPSDPALWMIGKNENSNIHYEVSYTRVPGKERWLVNWKAKWRFNDDLDLRRSDVGQTSLYNDLIYYPGIVWHDILGGRDPAPVLLEWEESGSFLTAPPKLPEQPAGAPSNLNKSETPAQRKAERLDRFATERGVQARPTIPTNSKLTASRTK